MRKLTLFWCVMNILLWHRKCSRNLDNELIFLYFLPTAKIQIGMADMLLDFWLIIMMHHKILPCPKRVIIIQKSYKIQQNAVRVLLGLNWRQAPLVAPWFETRLKSFSFALWVNFFRKMPKQLFSQQYLFTFLVPTYKLFWLVDPN